MGFAAGKAGMGKEAYIDVMLMNTIPRKLTSFFSLDISVASTAVFSCFAALRLIAMAAIVFYL